jgi:hypothetical protein
VSREYKAVVISMTEYRVNMLRTVSTYSPEKRADAMAVALKVPAA